MPHQTELQSGNKKTVTNVHAFTPKHTLSSHWSHDKWNWCNWWEWVIWIISNYRGSRESKDEELRVKENPIKRQLATWGNRNCISPNRRRRASARLSTVCMIQRRLWECNLSWLPVSPIHSRPFYNPPPRLSPLYQRDWLLGKWGFGVTQNHTSLTGGAHAWILSPPPPPRSLGFRGRGLCGGQVWRLSWRPDSAWWTLLYEIWKHGAWRTFLL